MWKDTEGRPIIFDGIDLSDSLLGKRPGRRETFIDFNDLSIRGILSSPGRYSGSDNGWMPLYIGGALYQFLEELNKYPNVPYIPYGPGFSQAIPPQYR